ncbi:NYN domain-containing protein [Rhizobium sp. TH2]|uniref:NYN domain-containing protein n=1 Tax=Rhizobium sp. TH2 TaxID=2775403 RepID=UPI002157F310|nr:NYN domain-containing protein [Rhizobium sp. TH2]UVC10205.1 NYN domain-containing protein [Rhizobium sp. TH2]
MTPRLAVLIDADNISSKFVERLFEEVATLGSPTIRRVYGDIARADAKGWAEATERFALLSRRQFVQTTGKNATDISMVIDAMDIMATDRVDGFCLVSSDSDFTPLAIRLREQGMMVYGFGATKAAECFRSACGQFVNIGDAARGLSASEKQSASHLVQATKLIKNALAASSATDGITTLSWIGDYIKRQAPEFSANHCGPGKLKKLVLETEKFEVLGAQRVQARR